MQNHISFKKMKIEIGCLYCYVWTVSQGSVI
jgi:hypothetical protein